MKDAYKLHKIKDKASGGYMMGQNKRILVKTGIREIRLHDIRYTLPAYC